MRGNTVNMLAGQRVQLRPPAAADRREYLALRDASREHLAPWEPTPPPGVHVFGARVFDRILKTACTETSRRFLVLHADSGAIVGQVSLNNIVRGAFQSCHLGYWIGHAHTRKGYMREALSLAITHAFDALNLHRVEANIMPSNKPSKALVKSLAFRYEGLARRYLNIDGDWRDHERWTITREEWDATLVPTERDRGARGAATRRRAERTKRST